MFFVFKSLRRSAPRPKIEAIVRRGNGVVDPDCPTSALDIGYWATVSRSRTARETLERSVEIEGQVGAAEALAVISGSASRSDSLTGLSTGTAGPAPDALVQMVRDSATSAPAGLLACICYVHSACMRLVRSFTLLPMHALAHALLDCASRCHSC